MMFAEGKDEWPHLAGHGDHHAVPECPVSPVRRQPGRGAGVARGPARHHRHHHHGQSGPPPGSHRMEWSEIYYTFEIVNNY